MDDQNKFNVHYQMLVYQGSHNTVTLYLSQHKILRLVGEQPTRRRQLAYTDYGSRQKTILLAAHARLK